MSTALAAVLASGATFGYANVSSSTSQKVHTCVTNRTGVVRIVGAATKCKSTEHALYWNQTGPVGPAGRGGATGAQGPTGGIGPAGAQGSTGDRGAPGPQGLQGATGPAGPAGASGAQEQRAIQVPRVLKAPPAARSSLTCRSPQPQSLPPARRWRRSISLHRRRKCSVPRLRRSRQAQRASSTANCRVRTALTAPMKWERWRSQLVEAQSTCSTPTRPSPFGSLSLLLASRAARTSRSSQPTSTSGKSRPSVIGQSRVPTRAGAAADEVMRALGRRGAVASCATGVVEPDHPGITAVRRRGAGVSSPFGILKFKRAAG